MIPASWIPHTRADGETVGYLEIDGETVRAYDVLGRCIAASDDWLDGERALDELGIAFLADAWTLTFEDAPAERVRIVEVTPQRIVVKREDFGAIGGEPTPRWELPIPETGRLAPAGPIGEIAGL